MATPYSAMAAPEAAAATGGEEGGPFLTCLGEAMLRYIPDTSDSPLPNRFTSRWLRTCGGSELNLTVALANMGWRGRARWISVVPTGNLGEELLACAASALPEGGAENLRLVKRAEGDVGIYHVWPAENKLTFQRRNSVFGQMDPDWFTDDFWTQVLSETAGGAVDGAEQQLHVLHLTGITPLIGPKPHKAWWRALRAAGALRAPGRQPQSGEPTKPRILVTLDLNHRPALGTFEDLWVLAEPHIGTVDVLVMSIGDLLKIGGLLDIPEAANMFTLTEVPKGLAGSAQLDKAVTRALKAVQERLGRKANLVVCCKQKDDAPAKPSEPPTQLRWSIVCLRSGETVSTFDTALTQQVVEQLGGGDAWLAGCIDGLVGAPGPSRAAAPGWSQDMWRAALQRGDMLATLKQRHVGDFSAVERREVDEALAKNLTKG